MPKFNRFAAFNRHLGMGVHQLHKGGHDLKAYLTDIQPQRMVNAIKADLLEIPAGGGYKVGGYSVNNDYVASGNEMSLTVENVVVIARKGPIAPFAHVILYNSTQRDPRHPLIGWWDLGKTISLEHLDKFRIRIGGKVFTINDANETGGQAD